MNDCDARELALSALVDGELDGLNAAELESHIRGCSTCAAKFDELLRLRGLLGNARTADMAPEALRSSVEEMLQAVDVVDSGTKPTRSAGNRVDRSRWRAWLGGGIGGALAATLLLAIVIPAVREPELRKELVASHVRSLQADHLTDVTTSNRHLVKPWFNGKVDFSPPVLDLSDDFPLVGGRLDYVDGQTVVALVYRRRLHTINLFIGLARHGAVNAATVSRYQTYSIARWNANGLEFWAVSDVDPKEMELFAREFRAADRVAASRPQ